MKSDLLAVMSVSIGSLIIMLASVAFWILVIIGLFRLVRYLGTAGKEHTLLRIELGKLSEEVHLLRQELKGPEDQNSSTDSN